jgi:sugar phosphate isomerase/epimerase
LVIAPREAEPSAFVVFRDRLDVSIAKASMLGYDAVELALSQASDVDPDGLRKVLDQANVGVAAISTGRVFAEQRAWLTSSTMSVRRRAITILKGLIDLAGPLGAPRVNIGRVRGFVADGESREEAEARFLEAIAECADHAAPRGVDIVIEPVNRYEINFINSVVPDGLTIVERIGRPNVRLMPDTFHMNIEDVSIAGSLEAVRHAIGYIQVADSNRWAPGQGHLDFANIIGTLDRIGYRNDIGVEILPFPTPDIAAKQAIDFLRTFIPRA